MKICTSEEELKKMTCPMKFVSGMETKHWRCAGKDCAAYRKDYYPYEDYYTCYCGLAGNPRG
jgi:hypothetical protein